MPSTDSKVVTHPTADGFDRHFDPKSYLQEMFQSPDDEDYFSVSFIARLLDPLPDQMFIHELGGGPTLYSVAALAPKASEIHFSDVVHASLAEVNAWLQDQPDAHNWDPYIALALEAEGLSVTEAAIAKRTALMREVVTQLMLCDAQSKTPIELENTRYDLVTAHHCTDVAATNISDWQQVLKNVTTIVRPGGWLMLSVTTGSRTYEVGEVTFECVNLTKEDIIDGLLAAGYRKDSILMETYAVENPHEYSGIMIALARRSENFE